MRQDGSLCSSHWLSSANGGSALTIADLQVSGDRWHCPTLLAMDTFSYMFVRDAFCDCLQPCCIPCRPRKSTRHLPGQHSLQQPQLQQRTCSSSYTKPSGRSARPGLAST